MDFDKIIYLGTSSDIKYEQYKYIFSNYGFSINKAPLITSLIEPQLNDDANAEFELLVSHPLRLVARFVSKQNIIPYLIEDTLLIINSFSNPKTKFGLPGADTKSWWNNLGCEGVLTLMRDIKDRKAQFISILGAYLGENKYVFSKYIVYGKISKTKRINKESERNFPGTNPFYFHSIFIPDGSKLTFAEMNKKDFKKFDYRRQNVLQFVKKIDDYMFPKVIQLSLEF